MPTVCRPCTSRVRSQVAPEHTTSLSIPSKAQPGAGLGLPNLERAGVNFYELREEYSEIALPSF